MFSSNTKRKVNNARGDLRDTYRSARRDVEDAAGEYGLYDIADNARRKVSEYADYASDHFNEATGRVGKEIRTNPIRSSLIALGVGYFLSVLFRR